jgi:Malectin domain
VGLDTALDKTFTATVGSNGTLTIDFSQGAANNPIINAIQIVPLSSSGSLSFATGAQSLTAGQSSAAMQVSVSAAQPAAVSVGLSSSSSAGQFATSTSGPWSSTLSVSIAAGQTTSGSFYYKDTKAGTPTLTASASGFGSATQAETVNAAALATITVSPASATVSTGGTQPFTASGQDAYGNSVSVSSAGWSTTAPGTVSPPTGSATTFTAGSSAGSGQVTATIGTVSGSADVTVTSGGGSSTVRVNAGGSGYSDSQGNDWSADTGFSGGMTYSDGSSVAGTSDPALYQSLRWNRGSFGYTFTGLAAGSYQVTLKFAEIAGLGPGKRQFNVAIQGTQVLTNFDVSGSVGLDTALDKTFTATVGSNGTLTIDFSQGAANNPIINAIQIVPG